MLCKGEDHWRPNIYSPNALFVIKLCCKTVYPGIPQGLRAEHNFLSSSVSSPGFWEPFGYFMGRIFCSSQSKWQREGCQQPLQAGDCSNTAGLWGAGAVSSPWHPEVVPAASRPGALRCPWEPAASLAPPERRQLCSQLSGWGCKASSFPSAGWSTPSSWHPSLHIPASRAPWCPAQGENPLREVVVRTVLHAQTPGEVKSQLSCPAPVFPAIRRCL